MPAPPAPPDDGDALVAAARSDRAAFGRLYEAYCDRVFRYCWRRLGRRDVAEDVCGDVFVQVARSIRGFAGTTDADFRRWVFRIATTETNAWLRRAIRRRELWDRAIREDRLTLQPEEPGLPSADADWEAIEAAVARLADRDRSLLHLRLFESLSFDEIGSVLGLRGGAARVAYGRAIARLRERLNAEPQPASHPD